MGRYLLENDKVDHGTNLVFRRQSADVGDDCIEAITRHWQGTVDSSSPLTVAMMCKHVIRICRLELFGHEIRGKNHARNTFVD